MPDILVIYILVILFWLSVLFVLYTYAVYPLFIALLARVFPNPVVLSNSVPSVTILITAYNEEDIIAKKIENTLDLDYPREFLQIIIAADGSSDKTPEIVNSYAPKGVELSYVSGRGGKIAAMNRAMTEARGEVVIFSDANNMYQTDVVRKLVAPFADAKVGAATGAKLIIQDGSNLSATEGVYWKYESWIKKNETNFSSCVGAAGEIFAVRRKLYIAPPNTVINDDFYIVLDMLRRGYRVCYLPEAKSFEHISASEGDEIIRRTRMSTGKYQTMFTYFGHLPFRRPVLLWQILSHKYFRAFLPFGFIGALFSNLLILFTEPDPGSILLLKYPYGLILFIFQLLFYLMAIIGNLVEFKGTVGKMFYLPVYLVNSNIAVLQGLYGYVTKRQTNIWSKVRRGGT